MVITELHIENIKGLQNFELKQSIQPNRPNILVAPNGFGKTSLAIAFKSLKNSKLDLDESSYYNGDSSTTISLSSSFRFKLTINHIYIKFT